MNLNAVYKIIPKSRVLANKNWPLLVYFDLPSFPHSFRCGQKQKLVINNGKGAVDDKTIGGLNGDASKTQEMVHLVYKEQPEERTGPYDEFLTINETHNPQEADLKTGV